MARKNTFNEGWREKNTFKNALSRKRKNTKEILKDGGFQKNLLCRGTLF